MELNTARLRIYPLIPDHINDVYLKALNDFSIVGLTEARHTSWDYENTKEFILKANSPSSILLEVSIRNINKPIGNVRLFNINQIHRRAELSMFFYDKTEWSKGYATEAIKAILHYSFEKLKFHRIVADYYATNIASSKVFKKLGFIVEGLFIDHFCVGENEFIDSVRVGLVNKI